MRPHIKEEKNILREVNKGRRKIQLARMFYIKPMMLSMILKVWDTIIKLYECYAICP
jgi:DNA-binding CsgD family transcriptional regulator